MFCEPYYFKNGSITEELLVTEVIQRIGIPANVKGYRYLRNAIMLAMEDVTVLDSMTKKLYPAVAHRNGTTPVRVERAIRSAISSAWDKGSGDSFYLENMLHLRIDLKGEKPTNSELIALISDHFRINRL